MKSHPFNRIARMRQLGGMPSLRRNLIALAALMSPCHAVDYLVSTAADESYDGGTLMAETVDGGGLSLREAIGLANGLEGDDDGDSIAFDGLVFLIGAPTISLGSELVITDDVSIDGAVLLSTASLDGGSASRLLRVNTTAAPGSMKTVTLRNLNLTNGTSGTTGGAVFLGTDDSLVMENVDVTSCRAVDGGAVFNDGGTLEIHNSSFAMNVASGASGSGGAIFNAAGGKVTLADSSFTGNIANRAGGAIEDQSGGTAGFDLMLTGVTFTDNNAGVGPAATAAPGNGGAIHITGSGSARIEDGSASGNLAAREGGAYWNGSGTMELVDTSITMNTASGPAADDGGGGVFNNGGTLTISGGTISSNTADGASGSGGGVFSTAGSVTITDTTLAANKANRAGGGIEIIAGTLSLTEVTLGGATMADGNIAGPSGSAAPGNGGGIHSTAAASIEISGGLVGYNSAALEGGGLWNSATGTMTLTAGAVVSDNISSGAAADDGGGGIFNNGGTVHLNSTGGAVQVLRNRAITGLGSGGGLQNLSGGSVTIEGAVFSGNLANRAGGAIEDASGNPTGLTLTNTTLSDNAAGMAPATASPGSGGGIHVTGPGGTSITNGLITGNLAASEGGGLWNGSGVMSLVGARVETNIASGDGPDQGGGGVFNAGGTVTISGMAEITGNIANGTSGSGGGLLNDVGGTVTITGSALTGNLANRAGGAIEDNSGAGLGITLVDVTMVSNNAGVSPAVAAPGNGGGVHISGAGDISITGGMFTSNLAAREGGALWNNTGSMTIDGSAITGNTASGPAADDGGGGIFNNGGTLSVANMTQVSGNIADGTAGSGGGIFNAAGGSLTVANSTISDNRANRAGGGIEDASGSGLGVTLTDVTMNGNLAGVAPAVASPGNGGAIHITGPGDIAISGGVFQANLAALEGGALWNGSGLMTVSGSRITGNTASGPDLHDGGGGIFNNGGTLTVSSMAEISDNIANGTAGGGGGIHNAPNGTVSVSGSTLSGNVANRAGGGIEDQSGLSGTAITLVDVDFTGNKAGTAPATPAPGSGGALHVTGSGGVSYTGGTVRLNEAASEGGGLWNGTGMMSLMSVDFTGNIASGAAADQGGGAIFNAGGTVSIHTAEIAGNIANGAAGSGGGILNDATGTVSITNANLTGNVAHRAGGAIEVTGGTMTTVTGCGMFENIAGPSGMAAPGNGGAIHLSGNATFETSGSWYHANLAANEGGGLWNSGAGILTITGSAVTGNNSPDGGGLFNQAGAGTTSVVNTTISGNVAVNGGGIRVEGGTMSLLHVTLASNTASAVGGGVELTAGTLTTVNTIIGDNSAPAAADASAAFTASSFTLVEDGSGVLGISDGVNGVLFGLDPALAPLADNGGPAPSQRPLSTSPAIDAGDAGASGGLMFDQRGSGFPRTIGPVDLGAIEALYLGFPDWVALNFTAATPAGLRGPEDDPDMDGIDNLIEYLTGMNPESPDGSPFGVSTDDGNVSISYPRSKTVPEGIEVLESSTELMTWTPETMPMLGRGNLDSGKDQITLTVPTGGEPKFFLRLNASVPAMTPP